MTLKITQAAREAAEGVFSHDFNEVYDARPNEHLSKPIEVCVVGKRCVYLNDYRIAGGKPWFSENLPSHTFMTTMKDVVDAFPEEQLLAAVAERRAQREYFAAYHAWKAEQAARVEHEKGQQP